MTIIILIYIEISSHKKILYLTLKSNNSDLLHSNILYLVILETMI